jgi:ATP-binding cassette subfamily B protein
VALPVFGVLPPYLLALWLLRRFGPPAFLELRVQRAQLTGFFAEHLGAMTMLQRFDRSSWVRERAEQRNEAVYAAQVRSGLIPVVYFNGVVLIRSLGIVALLLYGSMRVAEGSLTVGGLVMGLGYLRQMFSPLMRLSHHLTAIETSRAAAVRISEILDTEAQICDPAEPVPWPGLRDEMALRDVTFHYQEDAPVLRGVDIKIRAGSHVGIVGATGAGKSTVLNLAMRFRDPVGGAVTVDGVDLRAMAVEDVRRHMGLVLQDVRLLPGTVLDNLGGQRDAARTALDTVGLAGVGLDTVVRSGMLSRGERQLLTFARALVGDPELLVLDEATSAVDPATEARVQQSLRRVMAGRTTITVAHRLQTVRDADQIYVLQEGWVAEVGNHDALLRADGVYAALHALQRPLP